MQPPGWIPGSLDWKKALFGSRTRTRILSGKLEMPFLVGTLSHHPSSPFLPGRLRRARMPRPFSRFSHVFRSISPKKVVQNSSFWVPKRDPKRDPQRWSYSEIGPFWAARFNPNRFPPLGFPNFSDFSLRRGVPRLAGSDRPPTGSDFLHFSI